MNKLPATTKDTYTATQFDKDGVLVWARLRMIQILEGIIVKPWTLVDKEGRRVRRLE